MKYSKLRLELYAAFVWAIFIVGAGQLALVLGGGWSFQITTLCCTILLTLFIVKVKTKTSATFGGAVRHYFLSTGISLIGNALYVSTVFIQTFRAGFGFWIIYFSVLILPCFIILPFVHKPSHVAQ